MGQAMRIWSFRALVVLLSLGGLSLTAEGQSCKDSGQYDDQNYRIRQVRISTPLRWLFSSIDKDIQALLDNPEMPVKAQDVFDSNQAAQGYVWLKRHFPELKVSRDSRFAVRIGGNTIANCDETTKTLDVVYRLFVFSPSYYYSRAFELRGERSLKRETVDTDATRALAHYTAEPYFGYNNSRKIFAGTRFTATLPNSFVNKFEIDASASPRSSEVTVAAVGTDNYSTGAVRHSEWRLAYRFSSIPADRAILRQGEGSGQIYFASRAFTRHELIVRFGGALESGKLQAKRVSAVIPLSNTSDASVTNVKAFVGVSMKAGLHSLKASYGVQLGNTRSGPGIDFVKHVLDAAANLSFPKLRALSVEGQFSAGTIDMRGNLPVVEKFYGGNAQQSFIEGSSWQIRANPLVRSFAENKLSQVAGSSILGLDRFASVNVTSSIKVWRRPLVPRDVWEDPQQPGRMEPRLANGIEMQFEAGQSQIISSYLSQTSEYKAVVKPVLEMGPLVAGLRCLLQGPTAQDPSCTAPGISQADPNIRQQFAILFIPPACPDCAPSGKFDVVATSVTEIIEGDANEMSDPDTVRALVVDLPPDPDDPTDDTWRSQINALNATLATLQGLLAEPTATDVGTFRTRLEARAAEARTSLEILDTSTRAVEAKAQAKKDLVYPRHVLDYLIREADLFSLSPVFMFDAARIRQRGFPHSETRYGVGGGLKFTFIGLDVTAGYVSNPNRRVGESRGEFLFKFDVSDLFK